jgi:hypothetical protein
MKYLTTRAKKALTSRGKEFVIDAIWALANSVDCKDGVAVSQDLKDFWLIQELNKLPKATKLTLISDLAIFYRDFILISNP